MLRGSHELSAWDDCVTASTVTKQRGVCGYTVLLEAETKYRETRIRFLDVVYRVAIR